MGTCVTRSRRSFSLARYVGAGSKRTAGATATGFPVAPYSAWYGQRE